jgi:phage FluMu protein Com
MPTYVCRRCGYSTQLLSNLRQHCSRLKPCKPVLANIPVDIDAFIADARPVTTHKCASCNKCFASASSLCHHTHRCPRRHEVNEGQTVNIAPQMSEVHIDGDNNSVQQVVNITVPAPPLRSFGSTELQYIRDDIRLLEKCFKGIERGMAELAERIHFNAAHAENHNIRLRSQKQGTVDLYVDGKWVVANSKVVLRRIVHEVEMLLRAHPVTALYAKEYEGTLTEDEEGMLKNWHHTVRYESRPYHRVLRNIEAIMITAKQRQDGASTSRAATPS